MFFISHSITKVIGPFFFFNKEPRFNVYGFSNEGFGLLYGIYIFKFHDQALRCFTELLDKIRRLAGMAVGGVNVDLDDLSFFLGRESLVFTGKTKLSLPRKIFFKFLSNNAVPASAFFRLPPGRVIELGIQIEI